MMLRYPAIIALFFIVLNHNSAMAQDKYYVANADEEPEYIQSRYYSYPETESFAAIVTVKAKFVIDGEEHKIDKRLFYQHFHIDDYYNHHNISCTILLDKYPEKGTFLYAINDGHESLHLQYGLCWYRLHPHSSPLEPRHIKYLSRKIRDNGDGETIELRAKCDLPLTDDNGNTIVLKRGSTFIYDVSSLSLYGYVLHRSPQRTWLTPSTRTMNHDKKTNQ